MIKIHCKYDQLLDTKLAEKLFHPKNTNKHPEDQIHRLAKILEYQGWRYAIKISKLSNKITSGHGRVMAALHMGAKTVPVVYQEYESEEQEFADIVADNAIADWAEQDFAKINEFQLELGPFDTDLMGLRGWKAIPEDNYDRQINLDKFEKEFILILELNDESEQNELYNEFKKRGINCKVI